MSDLDFFLPPIQCLIVRLREQLYGIPVCDVRDMVRAQPATKVPGSREFMRGVMNLRGAILPIVDLRVMLGMASARSELCAQLDLLEARRSEHEAWLDDLEQSVLTGAPLPADTPAHRCPLGRWHGAFATDHLALRTELDRLDAPHKALHATASEVEALLRDGRAEDALALIAQRRSGALATLCAVLDQIRATIQGDPREFVVVVEAADTRVGLAVDGVESVEDLVANEVPGAEPGAPQVAIQEGTQKIVCMLWTGSVVSRTLS